MSVSDSVEGGFGSASWFKGVALASSLDKERFGWLNQEFS
jgi:hypothetical protein